MIVTVLGPIAREKLGVTDAHDHLFLRSPALAGQEFEDLDRAVEEVTGAARGGLQALVEVTPIGLGRDPVKMRAVAEATGVHIVAATGYHRDAHYAEGHWCARHPSRCWRRGSSPTCSEECTPTTGSTTRHPIRPVRA